MPLSGIEKPTPRLDHSQGQRTYAQEVGLDCAGGPETLEHKPKLNPLREALEV